MNTKKKVYVIINPVSGTSSKQNLPRKIAEALDPHKFDVHIFITGYAGHGSEIARQAIDDKVDIVIAVGGDGTINEVASTLVDSDTALGIIPMGSGNGLARDLNISIDPKKALEVIAEENIISIDYGKVNDRIFFCTCGVGFDAEVAAKVKGKKIRGSLMYLKNMLETFFEQKPQTYEIICPEGTIKDKAFVVTCANASQYGYNAHIAPHADIQDGMMNVAILKPLSILDIPQTSLQLFTKKIDESNKMIELITSRAIIKREHAGVMHIDGDPVEMGKEIHVEIIPQGLNVLVPKNPAKKHPLDPQEMLLRMLGSV
ncbi:diacylglycerol kinase family lipid kinase [Dysgonomonas sp. Marseille-P4677]|uniref:diacylglycerol/lipid kinase family protein n=1 Tax=Dysgonomonas sp. Marseille-P4677 TaxID=2364790 RepID=UPI001913F4E8|nr:diacylglycerol kinase family protein [Dysgonomonas sp. Marseille-P4677]MBK5721540.1 diacylglycerol kinase family lipid kinase [Dysgonomonas sp. Marseille-P4677]